MESWGPGMDSFDASTMNFWEVVQHTSPLDKHYWYFLVPPSGPTSGTKVCWKMESWGPFDTSIMNFGEVVQLTSPLNKHYWHFQIPPSGPASDSWECWNIEAWGPGLHSFDASSMNLGKVVQHTRCLIKHYWHFLRASFRLKVLENSGLAPSVLLPNHEFWGSCLTYYPIE